MFCRRIPNAIFIVLALAVSSMFTGTVSAQSVCCNPAGFCQVELFGCTGFNQQVGTGVCTPSSCLGRCCNNSTGICSIVAGQPNGSSNCPPGTPTTWDHGGTCSPNPCPPTGACCAGNASCSALTSAGCSNAGGEFQGVGALCSANPCTGACCNTTSGACSATGFGQCGGGAFQGIGSVCTPNNPCDGRCCNLTSGACTITGTAGCAGGVFTLNATCDINTCDGSCCNLTTGGCTVTGPSGCAGNTYLQNGVCSPNTCAQPGACCTGLTGVCSSVTAQLCASTGRVFEGVGASCSPNPCPQPPMPFAFTYQGRLSGGPPNGTIGARFTLWDSATSSVVSHRLAGPVTVTGVPINAGLFTAVVDFGQRVPIDRKTWLGIEVDIGAGFGAPLSPRQLMTFAPLAGHATAAGVFGTASQTLCVGPGAFTTSSPAFDVTNNIFNGVFGTTTGAFYELYAPINLPTGARIDSVTAYVRDTVTEDLNFTIFAKVNDMIGVAAGTNINFTAAGNSGFFNASDTSGGTIIAADSAYVVRVNVVGGTTHWPGNTNLAVMNVVIKWSLP